MARVQTAKKKEKSNAPLLLALLVLLGGATAWNYQRNLTNEKKVAPSAYATVSDADLDVLIAAYQSEIASLKAQGGPQRARARDTNFGQGTREFERVQRASRRVREAGYAISERQGALEGIQAEKSRRKAQGGNSGAAVFLRRAFTF